MKKTVSILIFSMLVSLLPQTVQAGTAVDAFLTLTKSNCSYVKTWSRTYGCNKNSAVNLERGAGTYAFDLSRYCVGMGQWEYARWGFDKQNYPTFKYYHNSGMEMIGVSTSYNKRLFVPVTATALSAKTEEKTNRLGILMSGASTTVTNEVSKYFNSPYLYLTNPPAEATIQLSSAHDKFVSKPEFNLENGWKITAENADQPLFYEAETASVSLNRHGRNFDSRAELTEFLDSEFLPKLGFSAVQSQNSLDYLVPKLPEANYYYLTILSPEAISQFSNLEISPAPESLTRTFYAIYPSAVPVSTVGDFVYPEPKTAVAGFEITELGEILVGEGIYVLWEK